jgi:hypothetical protein
LVTLCLKAYSIAKSVLGFGKLFLGLLLGHSVRDYYIGLAVQTITALLIPLLNLLPHYWKVREMEQQQQQQRSSSRGPGASRDDYQGSSSSNQDVQNGASKYRTRRPRSPPDESDQGRDQGRDRPKRRSRSFGWGKILLLLIVYFGATTVFSYAEVSTSRSIRLAQEESALRLCEHKKGVNSLDCETARQNVGHRRAEVGMGSILSVAAVQPGPIINTLQMMYWYVPRLSPLEVLSLLFLLSGVVLAAGVLAFGGLWIVPFCQVAWERIMEAVRGHERDGKESDEEDWTE